MENLLEYQTLSMFGTYSIAFALRAIGSVLAIWLALRVANNIRMSNDSNVISKLLGSAFGILVMYGALYWQMAYITIRANTANGLKAMSEGGMQLSPGSEQFLANFATDAVSLPIPVAVFDLVIIAMILLQIWMPKKA